MSQASNHVDWCLKKAEKEIEECKKAGLSPKHRGLIKGKVDIGLAKEHIEKAKHNLLAADYNVKGNFNDWAVSQAYYAMYHKATSLFYLAGIKCENHTATILLLKDLFNINNKEISIAKKERVDKQYYTTFTINKGQVLESIKIAEKFIDELDLFIDKITNQEKNKFKNIFIKDYFKKL